MTDLAAEKYDERKQSIINACPYGRKHFCNGDVNFSEVKKRALKKEPCPHFIKGRCSIFSYRCEGGVKR